MNKDYTQPFCLLGSVGRFHPNYTFYLPALELPEEEEILPIIPPEHRLSYRLQQLEGRFIHLENKVNAKRDIAIKKANNKYKYK